MTSWSGPGSTIRYYQCPFCTRTHSSLYGEVFERGAGARLVDHRPQLPTGGIPEASPEDMRWANIKATAARWFARLDADERRVDSPQHPITPLPRTARKGVGMALSARRPLVALAPAQALRRKA